MEPKDVINHVQEGHLPLTSIINRWCEADHIKQELHKPLKCWTATREAKGVKPMWLDIGSGIREDLQHRWLGTVTPHLDKNNQNQAQTTVLSTSLPNNENTVVTAMVSGMASHLEIQCSLIDWGDGQWSIYLTGCAAKVRMKVVSLPMCT